MFFVDEIFLSLKFGIILIEIQALYTFKAILFI